MARKHRWSVFLVIGVLYADQCPVAQAAEPGPRGRCASPIHVDSLHTVREPEPAEETVLAVSPCIGGTRIPPQLADAATSLVVTAATKIPSLRVVDRSHTRQVVQEQDLVLVSRAAAVLPDRFGEYGADRLLVTGVSRTAKGYLASFRLIDIATDQVIGSRIHWAKAETSLLTQCETWAAQMLRVHSANHAPPAADESLDLAWRQLDGPEARRLIREDLDRAESVYRQYRKAIASGDAEKTERLAAITSTYVADCISLLDRALDPSEGMVFVPGGSVEVPMAGRSPRRFRISGFFIDECEYTQGQYALFLQETGRRAPLGWKAPTAATARLPVTGVSWQDAHALAAWRGMRLPTLPEYLRAVRGRRHLKYPWGDTWRDDACCFARSPAAPQLRPVGSYTAGAGPFGVLDGVGGVSEWLDTWHSRTYWKRASESNPPGPPRGTAKLAAGGSFRRGPEGCTCNTLEQLTPATRRDDLGFRCVLPLREDFAGLRRTRQ